MCRHSQTRELPIQIFLHTFGRTGRRTKESVEAFAVIIRDLGWADQADCCRDVHTAAEVCNKKQTREL